MVLGVSKMEIIKNIAAVLGVILTAANILLLVSEKARKIAARIVEHIFKKYGETDTVKAEVSDIKEMLTRHIEDEREFKEGVLRMNEINIEFTKAQCRNIIKNIFYKYCDTKVLPLYEKKTLMSVEELYINRLNGNSFAALLLEEMSHWTIDYDSSHPEENEEAK